jgi:hypothetical protein
MSQLLPTIRSRCQQQSIPLPKSTELDSWIIKKLEGVAEKELKFAKILANGSPERTLFLLSEVKESLSLPYLLYFISILAGNWQIVLGLKEYVEKKLGVVLPDYIYQPQSLRDRQLKIAFYRYVCRLKQQIRLSPAVNKNLLLYNIEHFNP